MLTRVVTICLFLSFAGPVMACDAHGAYFRLNLGYQVNGDDLLPDNSNVTHGTTDISYWAARPAIGYRWSGPLYIELDHYSDPIDDDGGGETLWIGFDIPLGGE